MITIHFEWLLLTHFVVYVIGLYVNNYQNKKKEREGTNI